MNTRTFLNRQINSHLYRDLRLDLGTFSDLVTRSLRSALDSSAFVYSKFNIKTNPHIKQ